MWLERIFLCRPTRVNIRKALWIWDEFETSKPSSNIMSALKIIPCKLGGSKTTMKGGSKPQWQKKADPLRGRQALYLKKMPARGPMRQHLESSIVKVNIIGRSSEGGKGSVLGQSGGWSGWSAVYRWARLRGRRRLCGSVGAMGPAEAYFERRRKGSCDLSHPGPPSSQIPDHSPHTKVQMTEPEKNTSSNPNPTFFLK